MPEGAVLHYWPKQSITTAITKTAGYLKFQWSLIASALDLGSKAKLRFVTRRTIAVGSYW